jgi:hypothetical protein
MADPGLGFLSYGQAGFETAWATAVAAKIRQPIARNNPQADEPRVRPNTMDGSMAQNISIITGKRAVCDLEILLTYESILWFDWIMGNATFGTMQTPSGPVTGAYTWNWGDLGKYLNSMTWESGMGDVPTGKAEKIIGMKCNKATLKTQAVDGIGSVLTLQANAVGKTFTDNFTPTGALAFGSPHFILHQHITTLTNPSGVLAAPRTNDFTLEIDNKLLDKRFLLEGNSRISEPIRRARPMVTMSFTEEFQTKLAMDAYISNIRNDTPTGSNQVTVVFTTGPYILTIAMWGALSTFPVHGVEGEELLKQKLVMEAEAGGSQILAMSLVNLNNTYF